MSTAPITEQAAAWTGFAVPTFNGQHDTHIETGEDYRTITLGELFTMQPSDKAKGSSPAFLPSLYADYDARNHAKQREHGRFVALTADIDKGNHAPAKVQAAVKAFAGDAAYLIYTSAHARPGDMRWRVILPLDEPCAFSTWYDAQTALYAFMASRGIECDHALARAAQPVYLPNVPKVHAKTETPLRDDQGAPLYYKAKATALTAPGLSLASPPVSEGIAAIRARRAADEQERERMRREAEKRRASMPRGDGASIIDDFNASNSVATMLDLCGYEQSPRSEEDWRSPHQTGETYATRVMGSKWFSLSQSDVAAGVGHACREGCFGDAYDLYVHYKHGGDHKAAYRQLGEERRGHNVVPFPTPEPPEWMAEAPLPEPDDLGPWDGEPDYLELAGAVEAVDAAAGDDLLPLFDPADWHGGRPPERQWRWDSFIPDFQATLLTGAGAAGKSLATQQLCTCIAMGLPFLGIATTQARALYVTCEDDMDELHRRQEAICAGLGITLEQTRGKLFLLSLQGEIGNELSTFDHEGTMRPAPRYGQIERTCLAKGIQFVTLDNTAHTFSGNENDRNQVAAFVNLNNRLAKLIGGAVVMVGHPNKAGDSYSGSTAWENQVRSRLYLEIPKNDDGGFINPDMRVIRNEKANYSKRGSEVRFWWVKGAFIADDELPPETDTSVRESAQAGYENGLFLTLLDKLTEQRRHVSHSRNLGNYAPKVMAAMPEAKGTSATAFAGAMERLFMLDQIAASVPLWKGRDRHPVLGLARKNIVAGGAE